MHNQGKAVLFDLDGTLIDTAPDLVGALFATCDAYGVERPAFDSARQQVANGGVGLVALAFGKDDDRRDAAYHHLLTYYGEHIADRSAMYQAWTRALDDLQVPWGVVTNKPQALADALFAALDITDHGCLIGGDLLAVRKPDPAPLVFAAGLLGVLPEHCVYLGDHARDVDAARAAGMHSIAAAYGYLVDGDDPTTWRADVVCTTDDQAVAAMHHWIGSKTATRVAS